MNIPLQHTVYLFGGFQLDVTRRKLLSSGGLVLQLSSRAMDTLLVLLANAGEVVEKRRLMEAVWPSTVVEENNLNQCIAAIRKALGEAAGSNRFVMTVPGRGYSFVCPVRTALRESEEETVPIVRRLPLPFWIGTASCAGLLVLLILRVSIPEVAEHALAATAMQANTTITDDAPPAMLVRLREAAATGGTATEGATALLAHCLAARPELRLRVRVELVSDDDGAPALWSGHYSASIQDLLAVQESRESSTLSCNELLELASARQMPEPALP